MELTLLSQLQLKVTAEQIAEMLEAKKAKIVTILTVQVVAKDGSEAILAEGAADKLVRWEWHDAHPRLSGKDETRDSQLENPADGLVTEEKQDDKSDDAAKKRYFE